MKTVALHTLLYVSRYNDGLRLDGSGSIPDSARFYSSPQRPDRHWGPPSLLSNGHRSSLPGCKTATPHLYLVPCFKMRLRVMLSKWTSLIFCILYYIILIDLPSFNY
jgi:hypothetical protein